MSIFHSKRDVDDNSKTRRLWSYLPTFYGKNKLMMIMGGFIFLLISANVYLFYPNDILSCSHFQNPNGLTLCDVLNEDEREILNSPPNLAGRRECVLFTNVRKKLYNRKCLSVVVFGSSQTTGCCISAGGCGGIDKSKERIWWQHVQSYLSKTYPCDGDHEFVNHAVSASNSWVMVNKFSVVIAEKEVDLILVEYRSNDNPSFNMQTTEIFIHCLLERKNRHIPLLWYFAGQPGHAKVLDHYGFYFSHTFNDTIEYNRFLKIDCKDKMHWPFQIHMISAYRFIQDFEVMMKKCGGDYGNYARPSENVAVKDYEYTPYMAQAVLKIDYKSIWTGMWGEKYTRIRTGFLRVAEGVKKKFGLVCNDTGHLQIHVPKPSNMVMFGYLETYENIGGANIWISEDGNETCSGVKGKMLETHMERIQKSQRYFIDAYRAQFSIETGKVFIFQQMASFYFNICPMRTQHGKKFKIIEIEMKNIEDIYLQETSQSDEHSKISLPKL